MDRLLHFCNVSYRMRTWCPVHEVSQALRPGNVRHALHVAAFDARFSPLPMCESCRPLIVWNLALSMFSLVAFLRTAPQLLFQLYHHDIRFTVRGVAMVALTSCWRAAVA